MRLDVTGSAGVGIVSPCAPDPRGLFQEGKAFYPGVLELYGHTQTAKAGANNDDRRRCTAGTLVHGIFPLTLLWEFGYRVEYTSNVNGGRWLESN